VADTNEQASHVQETNLAWALAQAIKPHLTSVDRNHLFVAIGAGETFPVIRALLKWAAAKCIPLGTDLLHQCITWLDAYRGHADEQCLRSLLEDYLIPNSFHVHATKRVNRTPITAPLGALTVRRRRFGFAVDVLDRVRSGTS
jgi:hypothetical protein